MKALCFMGFGLSIGCKDKAETIDDQIKSLRVEHLFEDHKKPLKVFNLRKGGEGLFEISGTKGGHFGILVVNGHELGRKHGDAVSLINAHNEDEYLATWFSASRSYSSGQDGLTLRVKNLVEQSVAVVLYEDELTSRVGLE